MFGSVEKPSGFADGLRVSIRRPWAFASRGSASILVQPRLRSAAHRNGCARRDRKRPFAHMKTSRGDRDKAIATARKSANHPPQLHRTAISGGLRCAARNGSGVLETNHPPQSPAIKKRRARFRVIRPTCLSPTRVPQVRAATEAPNRLLLGVELPLHWR